MVKLIKDLGTYINFSLIRHVTNAIDFCRHGRPQYLNAKRYAEIRKLWLQHNIPIYVARQIEANYDIGGWTTL